MGNKEMTDITTYMICWMRLFIISGYGIGSPFGSGPMLIAELYAIAHSVKHLVGKILEIPAFKKGIEKCDDNHH